MKKIGRKGAKKKTNKQKQKKWAKNTIKKRISAFCITHFVKKKKKKTIALSFFGKS